MTSPSPSLPGSLPGGAASAVAPPVPDGPASAGVGALPPVAVIPPRLSPPVPPVGVVAPPVPGAPPVAWSPASAGSGPAGSFDATHAAREAKKTTSRRSGRDIRTSQASGDVGELCGGRGGCHPSFYRRPGTVGGKPPASRRDGRVAEGA